ncbi:MAG TPA: HDOD domain-containing protein [Terracidiphilus sp.]|jgi:EAL and modified HD-GYP domain-containing signal transduction protein|nr:HDOD domain-containing protein [Terracidiphilus sp.]
MIEYSQEAEERPVRYAARQPILAGDETVIGYKLLFRTDVVDHFCGASDQASRTAIDTSSMLGLNVLCDNRLAFIGCSRDTLLDRALISLPAGNVVAEVASNAGSDEAVEDACRALKDAGYKIALDDFAVNDPREPLTQYADFIKVDIKKRTWDDIQCIAGAHGNHNLGLVAEKVETREDFDLTRRAGFHYFQGYFFRHPETMRTRVPSAHQATYLRLLRAVSRADLDWDEVEDLIKRDAAIYFRLLRYINSAARGPRGEVHSVSQALTLMGENELRRWCRMAGAFEMSRNRPSDLMLSALVRGRFSELMAGKFAHGDADLFLVGLLSHMDAILEIPMGAVIEGLPLDQSSLDLLLENKGLLQPLYELLRSIECGAWKPVVRLCYRLGLSEESIAAAYSEAMEWAQAAASPVA